MDPEIPLEVRIFVDEQKKTITLQDTGIGMTHDELISHLGTIARSGSKQWVRDMKSQTSTDDIIGQFGVGFYSAFMVGQRLEVFSRSGKRTPKSGHAKNVDGTIGVDPDESQFTAEEIEKHRSGHYWTSTGTGEYEISEADGVERGTKIIIHLRDDTTHFGTRQALEAILKKYSNFVGFPIYLNGLRVNTVQAIWNMNKNEVTEEQHAEFYRYLANAYDKPVYRMHFNADVPLQINALFYFPERHMEKYGMGRMEPGTSLYSRKVLIKPKAKGLLPEYLRFVQGVVDSEDIPLNISRENMQDSLLISRISSVLTKRVIKHLQDEAKKNPAAYVTWFNEFGSFIREGICSDFTHKTELARLLRFDSSDPNVNPDQPTTLDDYISRMPPDQTQIYYLNAPNRKSALESPYYESIRANGYEVLFLYHPLDDFAMQNLREFNRRKLCSAESQSVETSLKQQQKQLQLEQEYADLATYVKAILTDKVSTVTITDAVSKYPAYIVDHESSSMRKMMKMMDTQSMFGTEGPVPIPKQKLHINPTHPIMAKLSIIKDKQPSVAKAVMEQVFDNALMAADLMDNPRDMLPRMQSILEMALDPTLVKQFEQEGKQ
jgi:HSP90 family molecular chaperone